MKTYSRVWIAGAALGSIGMGIGLAWADGITTGRLSIVGEKDFRVLVAAPTSPTADPKKKTAARPGTSWTFQYDADTEVLVGENKMKVPDLQKGWEVSINWRQDEADKKAPAKVVPVTPPKTGKVDPKAPITPPAGIGPAAAGPDPNNKNPMVATRIVVVTKTKAVQFLTFEGTDNANIQYEEESKAAAATKAKTKKVVKSTAKLHPNFKVIIEGQEADRSVLKSESMVQAEVIDDGGRVLTLLKFVAKKDAIAK
jgi:hypothetical protein